jgi:hypothetical protein
MQPSIIRQKAIDLRKKGYSYGMIREEMGLAKSTLSDWVSKIPYKPNSETLKRVQKAKLKSAIFKSRQKIKEINEMQEIASKELGEISQRDILLLGIGLYLGEGTKSGEVVGLVNSDPSIIKLFIKWFKLVCGLKTKNFKPYLHLYPDNNIEKSYQYWQSITKIPRNQFGKTTIDRRTNKSKIRKGKLPYGTMHLHIKSLNNKEHGRRLFRRIQGWIDHIHKQIH